MMTSRTASAIRDSYLLGAINGWPRHLFVCSLPRSCFSTSAVWCICFSYLVQNQLDLDTSLKWEKNAKHSAVKAVKDPLKIDLEADDIPEKIPLKACWGCAWNFTKRILWQIHSSFVGPLLQIFADLKKVLGRRLGFVPGAQVAHMVWSLDHEILAASCQRQPPGWHWSMENNTRLQFFDTMKNVFRNFPDLKLSSKSICRSTEKVFGAVLFCVDWMDLWTLLRVCRHRNPHIGCILQKPGSYAQFGKTMFLSSP